MAESHAKQIRRANESFATPEVLDDLQLGNGASRSEDGLRLLSGISSIEKFDYPE